MTVREQRLAMGFGAVLLVGAAFIGLTQLKAWKARVDERAYTMVTRKGEADVLLSQKDIWMERAGWLADRQPLFTKRGDADSALLSLIQKSASSHDVKLIQTQLTEGVVLSGLTTASMTVEGLGDMAKVLAWIYDLQQPGEFISIPSLSMSPNQEDTSQVSLTMSVQKWYRLPPP